MIAHCSCGTVHWAEPPVCPCPRCGATVLVLTELETLEEFEERILAYAETRAQLRSLRQAPA